MAMNGKWKTRCGADGRRQNKKVIYRKTETVEDERKRENGNTNRRRNKGDKRNKMRKKDIEEKEAR